MDNVDATGARTIKSVRQSAADLGLSKIDLVLIHWPGLFERVGGAYDESNRALRQGTWRALERLQKDGVVGSIGVSNFGRRHFKELLSYASVKPAVNQFEARPHT